MGTMIAEPETRNRFRGSGRELAPGRVPTHGDGPLSRLARERVDLVRLDVWTPVNPQILLHRNCRPAIVRGRRGEGVGGGESPEDQGAAR
jgi:hypothetical protein